MTTQETVEKIAPPEGSDKPQGDKSPEKTYTESQVQQMVKKAIAKEQATYKATQVALEKREAGLKKRIADFEALEKFAEMDEDAKAAAMDISNVRDYIAETIGTALKLPDHRKDMLRKADYDLGKALVLDWTTGAATESKAGTVDLAELEEKAPPKPSESPRLQPPGDMGGGTPNANQKYRQALRDGTPLPSAAEIDKLTADFIGRQNPA